MSLNFLITGGCGFIGSEAVRQISDLGHNVYNIDNLSYASSEESLTNISTSNYNFFKCNIADKNGVKEFISKAQPNYILNFAAESHVDRSIDGPEDFIQTNIVGTYNLLNESLSYYYSLPLEDKSSFKFIHISTDEVYGSLDFNDKAFSELDPFRPNSPYSASKASSDLLVRAWNKTFDFPAIITHSSNNYGPWQYPEKLIPLTVSNALKGNPIEIYGKGLNVRDWIFVKDHVEALLNIAFDGAIGETYNIGSNFEISNIDLVERIIATLTKFEAPKDGFYNDLITFVEDRPGHDLRYALNTNKITKELSWSPKVDIEEGLEITIKWMLSNKEWLLNKSKDHMRLGLKKK